MLKFLQLFTVVVAATAAEGRPCPFIQAMSGGADENVAANLHSPHGDHSRGLQPTDATFFVDWEGTGDGTTYDLDNSRPSKVYTSRAPSIANVPSGYTPDVFKSHRSSGVLTYKLYGYQALSMNKLSFGFAETYGKNCAIGQRVIAVTVNGVGVATGLDVFAEVGCNSALIVTSEIPANLDGIYEIRLDASVNQPMISSIAVSPASSLAITSPLLIHTKYSNDGSIYDIVGTVGSFKTNQTISAPSGLSSNLFRYHRYGKDFSYVAKGFVPNSKKLVTMGFAEAYGPNCLAGKRVFDIQVNGVIFAEDLDVFSDAGGACYSGIVISKIVQVNADGFLDMHFVATVNKAMVSFIKIESADSVPAPVAPASPIPAPVPTASPISLQSISQAIVGAKADIKAIITGPMAAKFVRLAFHDCVGGCNGCVDTSHPENFGLDIPMNALAPIVTKYESVLSRADIWVLAAYTAVEETQPKSSGFVLTLDPVQFVSFDMQYVGRPVCDGPANRGPHVKMPSPHFYTAELLDYFKINFGFSTRETVAIMGAHALGVATKSQSGFDGPAGWIASRETLNNGFYKALVRNGAVSTVFRLVLQNNTGTVFPNQYLWRMGSSLEFMLNADMATVINLDGKINPISGNVTCRVAGLGEICPDSPTLDIVLEYANFGNTWIHDFHDAFLKMTSSGCSGSTKCIQLL